MGETTLTNTEHARFSDGMWGSPRLLPKGAAGAESFAQNPISIFRQAKMTQDARIGMPGELDDHGRNPIGEIAADNGP